MANVDTVRRKYVRLSSSALSCLPGASPVKSNINAKFVKCWQRQVVKSDVDSSVATVQPLADHDRLSKSQKTQDRFSADT